MYGDMHTAGVYPFHLLEKDRRPLICSGRKLYHLLQINPEAFNSNIFVRGICIPRSKELSQFRFDEEVLYMKKSISRIIGVIMLIVAIVFIVFALNHPEKSFPWNNTITWLLYGIYFLVTVVLLIAPKMKK